MDWYYIHGNEQAGPVPDATLSDLAIRGVIGSDTLLWRPGMQDWQPARLAAPELVEAALSPGGSSVYGGAVVDEHTGRCSVCGGVYPVEELIQIGPHTVCAGCKPLYVHRLREGVPFADTTHVQFGGFWIRFVAKVVDGIILAPVTFAILIFLSFVIETNTQSEQFNPLLVLGSQFLMNGLIWAVDMAYVTFFVGRFGATPGKMACRLRVVTGTMEEMTYLRAFARFWGEFVTGMTFGIGYIIAAFDSEKRALHDYICNTRVIRV
ncbi:MAG: RDD family protein [Candidatus Hydrogenedentota bacterium]